MTTTITIETVERRDGIVYREQTQYDSREVIFSQLNTLLAMTQERHTRNINKAIEERHGKSNPTG